MSKNTSTCSQLRCVLKLFLALSLWTRSFLRRARCRSGNIRKGLLFIVCRDDLVCFFSHVVVYVVFDNGPESVRESVLTLCSQIPVRLEAPRPVLSSQTPPSPVQRSQLSELRCKEFQKFPAVAKMQPSCSASSFKPRRE